MPQRSRASVTPGRRPDRRAEAPGFVTIQFVTASALALVLFTGMANLVVFHYAKGVVRAALDEGVRAGARAPAAASECQHRAGAVVRDLLGGRMGDGVAISCAASFRDVRRWRTSPSMGGVPWSPTGRSPPVPPRSGRQGRDADRWMR